MFFFVYSVTKPKSLFIIYRCKVCEKKYIYLHYILVISYEFELVYFYLRLNSSYKSLQCSVVCVPPIPFTAEVWHRGCTSEIGHFIYYNKAFRHVKFVHQTYGKQTLLLAGMNHVINFGQWQGLLTLSLLQEFYMSKGLIVHDITGQYLSGLSRWKGNHFRQYMPEVWRRGYISRNLSLCVSILSIL